MKNFGDGPAWVLLSKDETMGHNKYVSEEVAIREAERKTIECGAELFVYKLVAITEVLPATCKTIRFNNNVRN